MYAKYIKRFTDITFALTLLFLLAPVIVTISILILFTMGSPCFFTQPRAGLKGKPFKILKFRTMSSAKDAKGVLKPDAERLTWLGRILRKLSLDELPQLFNILRGEMSFVGPRPLLIGYLPHYSENHLKRHDVMPGITGWAQVNGRQSLKWSKKFDFDVFYAENQSFTFDLKILWQTIFKVLISEGVKDGLSEEEDDLGIWKAYQESSVAKPRLHTTVGSLPEKEISDFIIKTEKHLPRPLTQRISLSEFVEKVTKLAVQIHLRDSKKLVGLCLMYSYDPDSHDAFIPYIAVLETHWGRGLGKQLIESAIAIAKEADKKCIQLEVDKSNKAARSFYEKLGFIQLKETDHSLFLTKQL